MSHRKMELEPDDFHVAVKRRAYTVAPWRWEIWAAEKTKPVAHSEGHFPTMSEATKRGKRRSRLCFRRSFPIPRDCVALTAELDVEDLGEVHDFLLDAEVVEGPPGFREVVAELWPNLLHKVKPPVSEMH
jgi:hypothetical protein